MIKQIEYTKTYGENEISFLFLFDGNKLSDTEAIKYVQTDEYTPYGFSIYAEHTDIIKTLIHNILHDKGKALVDRKSLEVYMQYALCKCQNCPSDYNINDNKQICSDANCEINKAELQLETDLAKGEY